MLFRSTCAYGLGVDKKNVRTVIHWEMPGSVEAYLQESGRAGRDGKAARAILLAAPDEERRKRREGGVREAARRSAMLSYLRASSGCRREKLLALMGSAMEGSCSGCDSCDGTATHEFEGAAEILSFIGKHRRRFDRPMAIARLRGERGLDPPIVPSSGLLSEWKRRELGVALDALIEQGRLRERRGWIWKGRFDLAKRSSRLIVFAQTGRARGTGGTGRNSPRPPGRSLARDYADIAQESPAEKDRDADREDPEVGEHLERKT